jgi:hypothetical protein
VKAVLKINYNSYVFELGDVLKVMAMVEHAERYDKTWHPEEEGGTTYNIWASPSEEQTLELVPDALYAAAKLAGTPSA